jgi:threonine synthase
MASMKYAEHIADLVGNTPLVKLNSVTRGVTKATVLAKVEYLNPGGSVKDRIALAMVEAAEASGALQPGGTSSSRPPATPAWGWPSSPSARATTASSSARTR